MKEVRLSDIAARVGVSIKHVSRALNESLGVSETTRRHIFEIARQLNYRDISGIHTGYIAVLFNDFENSVSLYLEALKRNGIYGVAVQLSDFKVDDEKYFDGAICVDAPLGLAREWHEKFYIPLLLMNNYGQKNEQVGSAMSDADQEMRLAVEHLADFGHCKIARLRPCDLSQSTMVQKRGEKGFFDAAEECSIRNFVHSENYEPASKIKEIIPRLCDEGFTAFIVVADPNYQFALDIFNKLDKRIPDDVSLIVYEMGLPPELNLTAIEMNDQEIIESSIKLLLDEITSNAVAKQIIVPAQLNIRGSTGKVKS